MGRDALGWRVKFGVIGPATNTIVQPDFEAMRPTGVTNHYSRIAVENAAVTDDRFIAATTLIGDNTLDAVAGVMPAAPDYLIMGMSAVTFYGGLAGAESFAGKMRAASGVGVSVGSTALVAALRAYPDVRRVAFLSPYFPSANRQVRSFLEEAGFSVARDEPLQCPTWRSIAEVQEETLGEALDRLDGDDVDALVQVGTNLSMVRLAAVEEQRRQKPVIAINTATYWHALRACGVTEAIPGFGRLLQAF